MSRKVKTVLNEGSGGWGVDDPVQVLHRTQQTVKSLENASPLCFAGSDVRFRER